MVGLSKLLRTLLMSSVQAVDSPSVSPEVCSDLRISDAEVTAKAASTNMLALELQVMKTTCLGRRLASRVHMEQMVQQMPSRATAACSVVVDASQASA